MNDSPIGILDSGLGGLSIWRSLVDLLPLESTIYVGDHTHFPYGTKPTEYIIGRVSLLIRFLLNQKAKLIIIACNTATVAGIDRYRMLYPNIPIIGVVPVVKSAAAYSKSKMIAILSTPFTSKSDYQKQLIHRFAPDCTVYTISCSDWVAYVENGMRTGFQKKNDIRTTLVQHMKKNIDVIVLGCTHFPFLRDKIRAIVGNRIQILDSGGAVARHVLHILANNYILNSNSFRRNEFYTSGNGHEVTICATALLGKRVTFQHVNV